MFYVYILFSSKLNKFYVGTTDNVETRLEEHNNEVKPDAFTLRGRPWEKYFILPDLSSKQAFQIEQHIKAMKSKKYIENLAKYPEMVHKLKSQYL